MDLLIQLIELDGDAEQIYGYLIMSCTQLTQGLN